MIEGIVGLFVILLIGLVAPYIKDYFNRETISYKVFDSQDTKPLNGDMWFDRSSGQTYVWNQTQWEPVNPKEGDVWFW